MKAYNIHILACKIGKVISVDYFNKTDSKNYSVEDDEVPHPDLRKALMAFQEDLASAYSIMNDEVVKCFVPTGFSVTETKGQFFLIISGKFETRHQDSVTVTSGKIPMEDSDKLVVKLNTLRTELWEYQWNSKSAQQEIPFEKEEVINE